MGQVGGVTNILAQMWGNGKMQKCENGAPKVPGIFLACRRENFFPPCVYTQSAQIFVENSNMGEKYEKIIRPPDPISRLALGCWPFHLSPVTCHSRGGGLRISSGYT